MGGCECKSYYGDQNVDESVGTGPQMDAIITSRSYHEEKINQPKYDALITRLCNLIDKGETIDLKKFRNDNKKAMAIFVEKTMIRLSDRDEIRRIDVHTSFLKHDKRGDEKKVQELIDLLSPLLIKQPDFESAIQDLCDLIDKEGDPLDFGKFEEEYATAASTFKRLSKVELEGGELNTDVVRKAYLDTKGFGDVSKVKRTIKEMKAAMKFDDEFKKLCKLIDPKNGDPLSTDEFEKYVNSVALLETTLKLDELPEKLKKKTLLEPFVDEDGIGDIEKLKDFIDNLKQAIEDDKKYLLEEMRRKEMARLKELETKFNKEFKELVDLLPSEGDFLHIKKFTQKQKDAGEFLLDEFSDLPYPMCSAGELKQQFGGEAATTMTEEKVDRLIIFKKDFKELLD